MGNKLNMKNKIGSTILLFLGGMLLAAMVMVHGRGASSYNPILSSSSKHYDAQIANPKGSSGYSIYSGGPYNTRSGTRKGQKTSRQYDQDYVRVMQTAITKTGTYAQLRYFDQMLGWMNVHGLKPATFSQVAAATMKKYNVIGSAILAPAGVDTAFDVSNGYAIQSSKVLNTANGAVVYPLASLQKSMTGVLVQQLIDAGSLTAQTPLSQFYPQIKGSSKITIQQLMAMTSGLENTDITPKTQMTENQAIASMIQRVKSTGNTQFDYSDANYVLLAGIIAKVTNQSYAQALQTKVFDKLGMDQTVLVGAQKVPNNLSVARSYSLINNHSYQQPVTISLARLSAIPGAGNLLTTPNDYYKFVKGVQDGQLLSADSYRQLLSYGSIYSGGLYVTRPGLVFNNGSFDGQTYHSGYFATKGNYHLAIVFNNQGPLGQNTPPKKFVQTMFEVAKYY